MKKVNVENVKVGSKLAQNISNMSGNLLLKQGTILTKNYIENLKRLNFNSIYIDDGLIDDVSIEDIISIDTRNQAINCLNDINNNLLNNNKKNINNNINLSKAKNVVSNLIDELINNREMMLNLSDIRSYDDYTFNHSINVTVISIIIGICLYYDKNKLLDLGLGVLLHDIGKTNVPKEILNKPNKLTAEEFSVVQKHTWHGFDILRNNPEIKLTSAHIALQHHERFDGSGYPRKLKGKDILEFARISSIADVYDALTNDRCYRKKVPIDEVYQILYKGADTQFDSNILNVFLQKIALYPNGTKVKLNNGKIGVVIKQNYTNPNRPKVRIIQHHGKELLKYEEINLLYQNSLLITDVIED